MRPYALKYIAQEELELFEQIRKTVNNLPDKIDLGVDDKGKQVILSCHILVRAVAKIFCLKYQDGYLYANIEHGWLVTQKYNIIDVYPVATVGGPIMIANNMFCSIYRPYKKKWIKDRGFGRPWFRQAVKKVTAELIKNQKPTYD